jgi:CNT family concentrative nucleoside transporter
MERAIGLLGLLLLFGIGIALSTNRRAIHWRTVWIAFGLQVAIALLALRTAVGTGFFELISRGATSFVHAADEGIDFVFGAWPAQLMGADGGAITTPFVLAVRVLPVIIFMSAIFSVLYHWGILQRVVSGLSTALRRVLPISGAESLSSVANIFLGMTEAPLMIKPYIANMTRSELFCVMTCGLSTVAGSVLLIYMGMVGQEYAGHLVAASFMSAPAGIAFAKLLVPEEGVPETLERNALAGVKSESINTIDALAIGTSDGLRLALNVGAMLVVFVAVIYLLDGLLGWFGAAVGMPDLSFRQILGVALAPLAFLLGVPWVDAQAIGELIGIKVMFNELISFQLLSEVRANLQPRSITIASYALCGFANFGSLGVLLGGLGGIAPARRADIARDGLRAVLAGAMASFSTAVIAGLLL